MKILKTRKDSSKNNHSTLKSKIESNKRANIFVGDETYKSNFFMEFKTPSFNSKFHKDIVIRLKSTIKALIALYFIFYLLDSYFYIKQGVTISSLLFIAGCAGSIYLCDKKYNGFYIRICMAAPVFILQNTIAIHHECSFAIVMLINLPIDVCTLVSWKYHISSMLTQNLLVVICILNNNNLKIEETAMKLTKLTDICIILILCIFEIILFSLIEKFLKEFWVIRETSEKSFRTFLSLIDDNYNEIFIIDRSRNLLYANKAFEDTMLLLIGERYPTSINEFVHENSFDTFQNKIDNCIKEQKKFSTNIFLIKKCQLKSSSTTPDNNSLSSNDSIEIYDCYVKPINWKGAKAVMVSLNNVMEQKLKQKLLINQSNEISTQFHDVIYKLEDEISQEDDKSKVSKRELVLMKSLLFTTTKLYNDFLFIKNVFELEGGDMRPELEPFSIKDFLLYSIELLLSRTNECKINLVIDPCLPEEVEGDLCKFRQIITAILDFSLKSTETVEIKVDAHFKRESGGYNIDFRVSFNPKFELKQEDLRLLFCQKDDTIINNTKMEKNVGLPIHVISKLVCFLGGSFKDLKRKEDGTLTIEFTLPFNSVKSSKGLMKTPKIKMNNQKSMDKGVILLKSPAPMLRKIKISDKDSNDNSDKSKKSLFKIEEQKSDNMSCDNLNHSDVSSVREAIQNFEAEDLKIKRKGSFACDSIKKDKIVKKPKVTAETPKSNKSNEFLLRDISSSQKVIETNKIQDISKKKKSQFVNYQKCENTISSDDRTSKRDSRISKDISGLINTNSKQANINKIVGVLRHPQLSKIENEIRKDFKNPTSSGLNSEEVDTNNLYDRNIVSERSIRLITDTPEQNHAVKIRKPNSQIRLYEDDNNEPQVDRVNSMAVPNSNSKIDVYNKSDKRTTEFNLIRSSDHLAPVLQTGEDQGWFCGSHSKPLNPSSENKKISSHVEFSDLDKTEFCFMNEFNSNEATSKFLANYRDINDKKPVWLYGASGHLIENGAQNLCVKEDSKDSKSKNHGFFSDISSELSKSRQVIEYQHNLSVQDHQRYMQNPTKKWTVNDDY